jgi:hypothetical protein
VGQIPDLTDDLGVITYTRHSVASAIVQVQRGR